MSFPTESSEDSGQPEAPTAALEKRPRAPTILERGASVGRYVVLDKLGAGGMGIVYAAFDPELDRRVAVKLLHPRSSGARPGRRADTAKARLLREAQALAKLAHPCVVTVHDVGTFENQVFVAMEFVDGVDLETWLADEPRSWQAILSVYLEAGRGLAAAHAAGIVHRDFKPDNVLVGRDDRVRVLDFGLARTDEGDRAGEVDDDTVEPSEDATARSGRPAARLELVNGASSTQRSERLTQVGAIMGTPAYMAPEQHAAQRTDARSDQFSFCVALYEALHGERPYAGNTRAQVLATMMDGALSPTPKDALGVPGWVRRAVVRGLAPQPDQRWPDMAALLAALSPRPKTGSRRRLVAGSIVVTGALAAVLAWPDAPSAEAPCQGAAQKLAGVWDDAVRDKVRAAFDATGRPYAAVAFSTSQQLLDDYARQWAGLHTEACLATSVRKEQSQELLDRQMICLGRRLKDVRALTRLLSAADAQIVTRAVAATTQLPRPQPCMDAEGMMSGAAPLTGDRRLQAAKVDDLVASARQLDAFARYDEALATASDAREAALVLDETRRRAESTALVGRVQLHKGDAQAAEQTLLDAVWLADEANADLVRATAWIDLVWVVGRYQARYDEVPTLRRHAESALRGAGGDALLEANLRENLANIASQGQGDPKTALQEHTRALVARRDELGADAPQVAKALVGVARSRADLGQYDAAERDLEDAMTIFVDTLGPAHPHVANVLHMRGVIAFQQGDHPRAARLLREALVVRQDALPPTHLDLADGIHDLGEILLHAGDQAGALPHFRRAAQLKRTALGEDHASTANSLTGTGRCLVGLDRLEEAAVVLEEALATHDALGTKGQVRAETEAALARALASTAPKRALALTRSARAQYSQIGKPEQARQLDDLLQRLAP
ncbi:MAG: serine/threonine-protein kinase [Myxococcota bacterium]